MADRRLAPSIVSTGEGSTGAAPAQTRHRPLLRRRPVGPPVTPEGAAAAAAAAGVPGAQNPGGLATVGPTNNSRCLRWKSRRRLPPRPTMCITRCRRCRPAPMPAPRPMAKRRRPRAQVRFERRVFQQTQEKEGPRQAQPVLGALPGLESAPAKLTGLAAGYAFMPEGSYAPAGPAL